MALASPSFLVSFLPTMVALDVNQRDDMLMIRFTNAKALFDAVRQVDVLPADFKDLCLREKRPFRIRRYHANQGYYGGDGGEGDLSGGPVLKRGLKGSWPTLVIEAGDFKSSSALRDDMRWWFLALNYNVKIVLLTNIAITRDITTDLYRVINGALVLLFWLLFL
ncbi:hypothetical protein F4860DRAFT_504077 [Xylaria cubensis]|nr:hypothetical protein F4860DRAFT_504077 [Xylaria cubensis]